MLDIGIQEILVIMVLALIVFGPEKLPDLGRRLGRAMREFRRASDEFRSTVEQNLQINGPRHLPPSPSPVEPQAARCQCGVGELTQGRRCEHRGTGWRTGVESRRPRGRRRTLLEPYWTSRGGRLLHRRERLARPGSRIRANPDQGRLGRLGAGPQALPGVRPGEAPSPPDPPLFADCLNGC
jgi:TatA/E family protein of Tat protein translocase